MAPPTATHSDGALNMALAVIASSNAPVLLLDGDFTVIAASMSFYRTFKIDPAGTAGHKIFTMGTGGEWNVPQLRSLLDATAEGNAKIDSYEMDLKGNRPEPRRLVLNAQKLDYEDGENVWLLLAISDITDARISENVKDQLLRDKAILLQEVQHRVANSLQIIASVLMMSARKVQSEETRGHLHDAHSRVMSIAAVQQQLASSTVGDVKLLAYFTKLCDSLGASMIRDQRQLTLRATADDSIVSADISVSLGLIVTELVINALKHAFPADRIGKITVDYRSHDGDWTLSVTDNGVGMPADPKAAPPGLGTSIVEALANRLQAEVQVANANPGTTVSIAHTQVATLASNANALQAEEAV